MADDNKFFVPRRPARIRQRGVAAVEFGLLVVGFFFFVFGICELARAVYLINTLQEVTRRAAVLAANTNFSSVDSVRRQALFGDQNGNLILGAPITPQHLKIEYLSLSRDSTGTLQLKPATMPSCPARNRLNCLADPYSESCIRFIRVRVCEPASSSSCDGVGYQSMFTLIDLSAMKLPTAATVVPAGSLGYTVGSVPCP
jgi:hypothetical protein